MKVTPVIRVCVCVCVCVFVYEGEHPCFCLCDCEFLLLFTFRQGIAHIQHRHQIVDVTVDALSHTGILRTSRDTERKKILNLVKFNITIKCDEKQSIVLDVTDLYVVFSFIISY